MGHSFLNDGDISMENATWLILLITTITTLIWYYERRTVQLELHLDSALDELDTCARTHRNVEHDPPFNLDHQPAFTREQIEHWN